MPLCFHPTWRLIPSRFPPVDVWDRLAPDGDRDALAELEGWTNDRLVAHRYARLPPAQRIAGRPNASVVLAAFLHPAQGGSRFSTEALGAWYAAAALITAIAEVAHHLRRELVARNGISEVRTFRTYHARLAGEFHDLRGARPDLHDPSSYAASQAFAVRAQQGSADGLLYDSVRHPGGTCAVAWHPTRILDVTQGDHWELTVPTTGRVVARKLAQPLP